MKKEASSRYTIVSYELKGESDALNQLSAKERKRIVTLRKRALAHACAKRMIALRKEEINETTNSRKK